MTQQTNANDILMGNGGAPTAKFDTPGRTIGGRIVSEPVAYQEREYDPRNPGNGAPKFYPQSGDAIMSVRVDVSTTERDPADPEDDGTRRIYIEGKRLKDAVRDSVRQAKARGLEVGGTLNVTFTGLGQAEGVGMSPPKLYQATYQAPVGAAANAALMGGQPQPQAPQATPQVAAPPPQQAPPAPAAPEVDQAAQMAAFQAWQASQAQRPA